MAKSDDTRNSNFQIVAALTTEHVECVDLAICTLPVTSSSITLDMFLKCQWMHSLTVEWRDLLEVNTNMV